jgi:hypothetical protein
MACSGTALPLPFYRVDDVFDSRQDRIFFFPETSRPALGATQPHPTGIEVISCRIKLSEHGANNSPTSSAEVKNMWSYASTPAYVSITWRNGKRQGE